MLDSGKLGDEDEQPAESLRLWSRDWKVPLPKTPIDIVSLLGRTEPAQRPMNTQGEIGMMIFTFQAMTGLGCLMVHGCRSLMSWGARTGKGVSENFTHFVLNADVGREASIRSFRPCSVCLPVWADNVDGAFSFA